MEEKINKLIQTFHNELQKEQLNNELLNSLILEINKSYFNNVLLEYYIGRFYEKEKKYNKMIKQYLKCIKLDKMFVEPYFNLCNHYVNNLENSTVVDIKRIENLLLPIYNKETSDSHTGEKGIHFTNNMRICSILGPEYIKSTEYNKLLIIYNPMFNFLVSHMNKMSKNNQTIDYIYVEGWKNICVGMGAAHINKDPDQAYSYYYYGLIYQPTTLFTNNQLQILKEIDKTLLESCILTSQYSINSISKPYPKNLIDRLYDNYRISQIDILVVGTGGTGTTSVIHSLNRLGITTNHADDIDRLKHLGKPIILPNCINSVKKVIYVYGDPTRCVYSIYKRSVDPNKHFSKLVRFTKSKYTHTTDYSTYIKDVEERIEKNQNDDSIKGDAIKIESDISGIYRQFKKWLNGNTLENGNYSIFMLDFQQFNDDTKKRLIEFIGTNNNDNENENEEKVKNLEKFDLSLNIDNYQKHDVEKSKYETPIFKQFYDNIYSEMASYNGKILEPVKNNKIKIAYISPDFNYNAVGFFLTALLKYCNKDIFEVYCYYNNNLYDKYTNLFKSYVNNRFYSIYKVDTYSIYNLIRSHNIDIIIDLSGHGYGNRMDVLSMSPAPIIINYCGFPDFTYLNEIKYRIVDKISDPVDNSTIDNLLSKEKLIYLPKCFLCYTYPENEELPIINYNMSNNIYIGIFNKSSKQNVLIRGIWKKILQENPNCILCIKMDSKTVNNQVYKELYADFPIEQVKFFDPVLNINEYFNYFNQIDFCIDTYPYSGTTTTCASLLMGVPTFTIYNETNKHVSNVSTSILKHSAMPFSTDVELEYDKYICKNIKDYKNKICNEIEELINKKRENINYIDAQNILRENRRKYFLNSMEPKQFMKEFEDKLLELTNS